MALCYPGVPARQPTIANSRCDPVGPTENDKRRGGSGEWPIAPPSQPGGVASDVSVRHRVRARGGPAWAEDLLQNRPQAEERSVYRTARTIMTGVGRNQIPPEAVRWCPVLPEAFRARRASLRSSLRRKSPGPRRNERGAGKGRFALPLNRLFSCSLRPPRPSPRRRTLNLYDRRTCWSRDCYVRWIPGITHRFRSDMAHCVLGIPLLWGVRLGSE